MAKHAKTQDVKQARQQDAEQGGKQRQRSKKEIWAERNAKINKTFIKVIVEAHIMAIFFSLLFWNPFAAILIDLALFGCWMFWKRHKALFQAVKQAFAEEFSAGETPTEDETAAKAQSAKAPSESAKAVVPVENVFSPGSPQNAVFEVRTVSWDTECLFVDDALTKLGVPHGKKVNGGVARLEIDPRNVPAAMSMLVGMERNVAHFTESRVRFGQGFNVSAQEIESLARETPAQAAPDDLKASPSCSSSTAPAA